MDKLKAITTFIRIAEAGSLSAAARALDMSLPAVVRSLAALEQDLGVRLFNRTTRRIALTAEGQHYLGACRGVLAGLDEAEAALHLADTEPQGELRITAPVACGQYHVAPVLNAFMQRHPRVRCNLLLLDRVVDLVEEGLDLAVRIGHLEDSSLVARPVGQVRRLLVASPAYLARHPAPTQPQELAAHACVLFQGMDGSHWTFHDQGRPLRISVQGRASFNHIQPAVEACASGLGIGRFLSYQVASLLAEGRLVTLLDAFAPPPIPVQLVYPHGRLLPARVRSVLDFLQAELKVRLDA
jgi:DNA-binding transcriptional LysR family regulator